MSRITAKISPQSPHFAENEAHNLGLVEEIAELAQTTSLGGAERSRQRHVKRGKMLPRDRVLGLLDAGAAFLEIGLFAAHEVYDTDYQAAFNRSRQAALENLAMRAATTGTP